MTYLTKEHRVNWPSWNLCWPVFLTHHQLLFTRHRRKHRLQQPFLSSDPHTAPEKENVSHVSNAPRYVRDVVNFPNLNADNLFLVVRFLSDHLKTILFYKPFGPMVYPFWMFHNIPLNLVHSIVVLFSVMFNVIPPKQPTKAGVPRTC